MADFSYKEEISNTRKGCVGSSDAKMLAQICSLGYVPKSAYKRMAVIKGLVENEEIPYTDAVRFGDEMEMQIFSYLKEIDDRYESNPMWVSERYSRKNCKCITHPDYVLKDDEHKILNIYECKTSRHTIEQLRQEYKMQLYHHSAIGKEIATKLGRGWKVKVHLVHYNTEGLDLSQPQEFDENRLERRVVRVTQIFDIHKAMDIVDEFLETFNEYYPEDEVPEEMLPEQVKSKFDLVSATIAEIEEKKKFVEEFKCRLYEFMKEKEIKSIKGESFSITRVDETKQYSFDYKKFLEDERAAHPTKTKRLEVKYLKISNKKGYVSLKLK